MEDLQCRREGSGEPNPNPLKPDEKPQPEAPSGDRFSSLPEPLLIHIVSSLPLLQVISLATVSKRCQHLWTMVPNLIFDHPSFTGGDQHIVFVNQTLALRRISKINKFSLPVYHRHVAAPQIDQWIEFAIKSHVEDLELKVDNPSYSATAGDYVLPEQLYTASSLRNLRLNHTSLKPVGLISWTSLNSLQMNGIKVSDEMLDNMMRGCPVLESLELRVVYGFKRLRSNSLKKLVLNMYHYSGGADDPGLEISAPRIGILKIYNSRVEKLPVLSSPLLVEAHFYIDVPFCDHGNGDCVENHRRSLQLFQNLRHVEKLRFGPWLIQVMSMWKMSELPSPLLNCKVLVLDVGVFEWEIPGIANLLQSVPCLETLTIFFTHSPSDRYCSSCNFEGGNDAALQKPIALDHLKTVLIYLGKERLDEFGLKLAQFVLKNANALEVMTVYRKQAGGEVSKRSEQEKLVKSNELLEEATRVFSCPRSSPNAAVIFACRSYNFALCSQGGTVTGLGVL